MKNVSIIFLKRFFIVIILITYSLSIFSQNSFTYTKPKSSFLIYNKKRDNISYLESKATKVDNYLPNNFDKQGKYDYTKFVQKAIDENEIIIFPNFPILINDTGLILKSNQKLIFQDNSKIMLKSSSKSSYAIILIQDVSNIELYYPQIIGDRQTHLNNVGEWGMGIRITGSKNIKVFNPLIQKCWGDGIYISGSTKLNSSNITITNPVLDYNRRNGITIVSGKDISIRNAVISNTYGKSPMSGIDIEPNNDKADISNISISNYKSINNIISGLQIGISNLQGDFDKSININVNDIYTENSQSGIVVGGLYLKNTAGKISGEIKITNAKIIGSKLPIKLGRNYKNGPIVKFDNVVFNKTSGDIDEIEFKKFKYRATSRENINIK
ncbi:right-handed parallel beta-helix repeat-containing protein [Sphingobacterium sp. UGAL515B_05]|uniref:right-handed parallel beta-helix repeat-containing protein n=1 Tax=Sphingobacterium sp. UGAL515B_05 TaxID=2986767 RepID=UPI0029529E47|nr:right-handed parallel beta-helix repeat-containing protein [Sphingobacterium sp. UGAL515B_05]WON96149.1 right-handed parallel beta-helix repeat-containing protein [Sphingobacterium sp. UGAL515B_05]